MQVCYIVSKKSRCSPNNKHRVNEHLRRPERGAFWYKQRGIQMDLNNYNDPRVG